MGVKGELRETVMKKFVLPFSVTCASQASVAVLEHSARSSRLEFKSSSFIRREEEENKEGRRLGESLRHSSRFSRPNLSSNGVNRLMKGFKNLSLLLFNEDEMEELGMEIEIGCPTDVRHVTHIGWNDLIPNSPSVSLIHHFGLPTTSPTPTHLQTDLSTFGKPRDGIENMAIVPVTVNCISEANAVVPRHTLTRSKSDLTSSSSLRNQLEEEEETRESISSKSMRHSSKPNLSTGINRLMKGFKSLSQLFVDEDEMKEISMEMEIGCPTDVKHVTHIGLDGLANVNSFMGLDNNELFIPHLLSHSHTHSVSSFNKFSVSATVNATSQVA